MALDRGQRDRQFRRRAIPRGSGRQGRAGERDDAVPAARGRAGRRVRQTVRRGARAAGARRPASFQAAARNGRDRHHRRSTARPAARLVPRHGRHATMRANCWYGKEDVRIDNVPDPRILNPRDCIVRITSTAICGSDVHLYDGYVPTMIAGDILGHEFMGEVVEVGSAVKNLAVGDRVVNPFAIACGNCLHCREQMFSLCENTNPNAWMAEKLWGYSPAGLFGYSHMTGGYAGGQAEYVRIPFADVGPIKVPADLPDDQVLFLSDIFPTGYMAAENCDIKPGHVVAVWGCGPVGQFAIQSAYLLGAEKV